MPRHVRLSLRLAGEHREGEGDGRNLDRLLELKARYDPENVLRGP
jgi:berberine-like enzyme